FFCFFFSSRRRHTRFDCDWSSDVCSSDLLHVPNQVRQAELHQHPELAQVAAIGAEMITPEHALEFLPQHGNQHVGGARRVDLERSEERRVGKSVDLGGGRNIKKKKIKKKM